MANRPQDIEHRGWHIPFSLWAGPVLWGLQILAGYGLATVACGIGNNLPVLVLIGFSGLIVLVAAVVAYRAWHARPEEQSIFMEANQADRTATFLAVSGFIMSLLFFLLILATFVSDIFLGSCPIITMPLP